MVLNSLCSADLPHEKTAWYKHGFVINLFHTDRRTEPCNYFTILDYKMNAIFRHSLCVEVWGGPVPLQQHAVQHHPQHQWVELWGQEHCEASHWSIRHGAWCYTGLD